MCSHIPKKKVKKKSCYCDHNLLQKHLNLLKFYNLFLNHKYLVKLTTAVCSSVDTFGSLGKTANITVTNPDTRKAPTPAYLWEIHCTCMYLQLKWQ